jgi:hypothetical protein
VFTILAREDEFMPHRICRFVFDLIVVCICVVVCHGQEAATTSSLKPILEVLNKASLSGSLEFSGKCNSFNYPGFPEFPHLHAVSTHGASPLHTLRELFADNQAMRVSQEPNGTIRMIENGIPSDILNIHIKHISFDNTYSGANSGAYSANSALEFILKTPEVKQYLLIHNLKWPFNMTSTSILIPTSNFTIPSSVPHISGSLDDVTLNEALDYILKTFPGIWIYESCPCTEKRSGIIYFRYYRLFKTINGVDVE